MCLGWSYLFSFLLATNLATRIPYVHISMHTCDTVGGRVEYLAHCGVHDASAVGPDGVGHVTNVDGVEVFVIRLPLYKYLQSSRYMYMYISHTCTYIHNRGLCMCYMYTHVHVYVYRCMADGQY